MGMVIIEGKGSFGGEFFAQLCESNTLFPNYFREDLLLFCVYGILSTMYRWLEIKYPIRQYAISF